MRINHNIAALNTYNQLSTNSTNSSKSLQKLSSGLQINKAGDDAAGLAISEKMRGQIRGLDQAAKNAQDGISLIQTAEGALNETTAILQRMRELAVQAGNDTLAAEDRAAITTEINQLISEIDGISQRTQFNGANLLDGTFGVKLDADNSTVAVGTNGVTAIDIAGAAASTTYTIAAAAGEVILDDGKGNTQTLLLTEGTAGTLNFDKLGVKITLNDAWTYTGLDEGEIITTDQQEQNIQIGANEGQTLALTLGNMSVAGLGLAVDVSDSVAAGASITNIEAAINKVSTERANLGAYQNRLEHTINNLNTSSENLSAAESRIRDVDMAKEMMEFTKTNILSQAATAMLAQANQQPQQVLKLLQ